MKEFAGKVAVVTGAASGIGRGMAERFLAEGMRVALADVESEALAKTEAELQAAGGDVFAMHTDVSARASVDALANAVLDRFGPPNILCNNAGVSGGGGPLWATTENDWRWVLGVNLMGVVHGIQAFVPSMVESKEPGHVVNTSSVLGLSTGPGSIYGVSKHAVTRLSEGLWYDLKAAGAPIGVSVLCPGMIATNIITAARNRPADLRNDATGSAPGPEAARQMEAVQARFLADGMPPAEVAGIVLVAIREDRFYVLTHPDITKLVEARTSAMIDGAAPPPTRSFMDLRRNS
jgi:NAD(P)-dependent dehydrogenase (short-subunit alcohol dehydrogenase family)